jgi:phenylalanyl-tRNA synthetase beta chain
MQFPESWLRTLVNPQLSTSELAHKLTMAGLEVEAVQPAAVPFSGVVVAEVLSVAAHPDADRLRICKVNVGEVNPLQIVCGAANVAVGQKVPCARVGAQLPNMEISQAKVRGVESFGMLCGASEIGLEDKVDGLLVLPGDAPVGTDIREFLSLDDNLITLKLTPNRADCLSVAGLAREVAAITGTRAYLPSQPPVMKEIFDTLEIEVKAPDACPRYAGRVIRGINANAQTPEWMSVRLERSGVRCISAPVDITNYVLLELGQPMHAFDLGKLGDKLQVRWAQAGEKLALLNEQMAELSPDMLVIADASGPLALAGIMGGAATAVGLDTTDNFLEAAWFSPGAIAGRARRLGLSTDSSHRFERGVDYASTLMTIERATKLILEICGGQPGAVIEKRASLPKRETIRLRPQRVSRVLGVEFAPATMQAYLHRLGLAVKEEGEVWLVTPPSYRFDLTIEEDLIEEVARLHGYDQIEARMPRASAVMLPQDETAHALSDLRRYLVGRDYQEVITYSFVDPEWEKKLSPGVASVVLQNPIASQMSVMRTTLWGGMIGALSHNLNRQQPRVRLFELGRAYLPEQGSLRQPMMMAGICHGTAFDEQWGTTSRPVDFYDVKGDLEQMPGLGLEFEPALHPALHPGQSARIRINGEPVGWLGTLHHKLVQHFDLPAPPVMFELDLDALGKKNLPRHRAIPRFPSVRRDLAFVLDQSIPVGSMLTTMRAACSSIVRELEVFDLYQGQGISDGQKSLAFRIVMQDTERTLTESEVEETVARIAEAVISTHDAKLRS